MFTPHLTPDAGLVAAVLVAAGVTALVAIGMLLAHVARRSGVTLRHALASAAAGLGIVTAVVVGVLAASPQSAAAEAEPAAPVYVVSSDADAQLPTLALGE